ncbi:MAG: acetate--CoA ligase family protein [Deltaproteobacteria bacterium]|nr:acetate--CoA ligase family protein [Deltaproteobacteria bacterium]
MREFFYPQSVAVVGVSPRPGNLGQGIVGNMTRFGFQGILYEVGPSGGVWAGRRIHRSVADIPDQVDLAVVLAPARFVPGIVDECGEKGIRRVVVETGGFREHGPEGRALEEQLLAALRRHGMRMIGPNGLGVLNAEVGLAAPFMPIEERWRRGDVSILAQSGGVGLSLITMLAEENLGLNKFVSLGNMLDVGVEELLAYLIEDPGTRMIVLYLEGVRDGRRLTEVARTSGKPILAIKGNVGTLGRSIAASHTASLSNDDRVVDTGFAQAGIVRVRNPTNLAAYVHGLRMPPMRGPNLAVLSRSGGHAVLAADACERYGFELSPFPAAFLREIEGHFRASVIKLTNPLDLGDLFDLEVYRRIIDQTLQLPEVHGVLFLLTYVPGVEGPAAREVLRFAGEAGRRHDKPVVLYVATAQEETLQLKRTLEHPVWTHIDLAVRSLRASQDYLVEAARARRTPELTGADADRARARRLLDAARAERRDPYLHEAVELLECYGIPVVGGRHVRTVDEAAAAATALGWPVAIKVVSRSISHKSDFGGVQLNLRSEAGLRQAWSDMHERIGRAFPEAEIEGALVQPMVTGGREMIVGGRRDPAFGPVVLVGLGGVFVEILREAALRVFPFDRDEARRAIDELRGAAILRGARGSQPADLEALVDVMLRLGRCLDEFPEIREVDVNPLRVFPAGEGCRALDARVILEG